MTIAVRPLEEHELVEADRIFRVAFGTFVGLPDPLQFGGDSDYVRTRWRADPSASFAAVDGRDLLGSNFATRWGTFGFFGPLTVRPDLWDRGVARRLLDATMERFAAWHLAHAGLFTFAQSAKHVGLYQRYGFYPRFLTAIMEKPVSAPADVPGMQLFSALPGTGCGKALAACRRITDQLLDGLDLSDEIVAVQDQSLGDTVLTSGDDGVRGFAVCHVGAGTEAGSGVCYAKFAAVAPGPRAAADFSQLLDACERLALARGAAELVAGVNTAREGAYRSLLERGFRTIIQGVAMQRPNDPIFNRADVFAIDDWR